MAFDKAGQVARQQVSSKATDKELNLPNSVLAEINSKLEGIDPGFAESYRSLVEAYNLLLVALQNQIKINVIEEEISFPAGADIAKHSVVYLNDAHFVFQCPNDEVALVSRIAGLAPADALAGEWVTPIHSGIVFDERWEWDTDQHVYLGDDGELTDVAPVAAPDNLVFIEESIASNLIRVHIDYPITLP